MTICIFNKKIKSLITKLLVWKFLCLPFCWYYYSCLPSVNRYLQNTFFIKRQKKLLYFHFIYIINKNKNKNKNFELQTFQKKF